jgi:hypothetical protein
MKVLLLSDNPAFGGTSRYCMNLALGLRQLGVDLTILAPYRTDRPQDDWLLQEARKHGIPVQTLIRQGALDWKSVVALKRILLEGQFEIVHSQGYLSNVLARLAIKLGRTRTKFRDHAPRLGRRRPDAAAHPPLQQVRRADHPLDRARHRGGYDRAGRLPEAGRPGPDDHRDPQRGADL